MNQRYLYKCGYEKTDEFAYKKTDKKTGMTVELKFNRNGTAKQNKEIENNIIKISTRQDF